MNVQPLLDAINDRNIVSGLTHDVYRYPARFSPLFARTAINLFTNPGETVLDPFMGGSTSLVEALAFGPARGRHGYQPNLSVPGPGQALLLSDDDLDTLPRPWADLTVPDLSPRKPVVRHTQWMEMGYQTDICRGGSARWPSRRSTTQWFCLMATCFSPPGAWCLKTVQWAVDCKKALPTAAEFRGKIIEDTAVVADGLHALQQQVEFAKDETRKDRSPSLCG